MGRFVEGVDRSQMTLFPECLDDWIDEDNPVRVIDAVDPHRQANVDAYARLLLDLVGGDAGFRAGGAPCRKTTAA